ncbi:AEC family transporter [Carnobacterium inhibens]|uniref:Permease n=1 Tax=Carnobacterium inhibens subsp. gilichinskyi TaxID=1266845 RepID=U5SEA0_9LACT|nr:AEC family transporter [Carnobacterium inhibens]AGY82167.1 permease [Carnobacterium inhibens subsp. gilichinskyi]MCM3511624.1 AEC family transporter [Carnobacterium inhibens]
MSISSIILQQLGSMFVLIFFGYILVKRNVLNPSGTKQIANMLANFITPVLLFMSFQQPYQSTQFKWFLATVGIAILLMAARIIVNYFFLRNASRTDRYATTFTNAGFIGIPLVQAVLGFEGVFFVSAYSTVTNILQRTYGIYIISGDKSLITPRNSFLNPASLGSLVGLIFYLLQIELPTIMSDSLYTISDLNTPLAMILLGSYVAESKLADVFTHRRAYWTTFLALILSPLISIAILWLLPLDNYLVFFVLAIATSAPIAVNTALFSQLYGGDYEYGARLVVLSTLLSLISMPLVLSIAEFAFSMN